MEMRRKWVIVGIGLMMFLGAPIASMAQDKSAALQQLYEAAKREGSLVVHDGGTIEEITPIMQAFEKRFPGIKVQAIVQPQPSIPQRIIMEAQAGKTTIDVARGAVGGYLLELNNRGLLRKVNVSKVIDIDPTNVWGGGILHIQTSAVPCIVYNTNSVSKADEPRTWEDLLNPKWKGGKIYLSSVGMVHAVMFFTRKEGEVVEYLKKLRNQEIVVKMDPRACTADVSSGEAFIGETLSRVFIEAKERGAPVDLAPISPVMYIPDGTYAMNGAPHPNAADLWIAWRQTPEGRELTLKLAGEAPEMQCTNCPSAQYLCNKGIKFRVIQTIEDARLRGEYQAKVQELLGMKPKK
jgi:iron(III) transport system substrate-binding protein